MVSEDHLFVSVLLEFNEQWFDKLYQLNGQFVGKRRKVVKKNPVKILDDFLSPGKSIRDNFVLNNGFGHDLLEFYLVFIIFN